MDLAIIHEGEQKAIEEGAEIIQKKSTAERQFAVVEAAGAGIMHVIARSYLVVDRHVIARSGWLNVTSRCKQHSDEAI